MKDILIEYGIQLAVALIITLIGIVGAWVAKRLAKKIELANIAAAQKEVTTAAEQTVLELQQTIVDDLKAAAKDGKLSKEEIADLGAKLLSMTVDKLSASTVKLLEAVKIDVAALIKSAGEAYLAKTKYYME